jgi:predicted nucleic acid-binding protein
MTYVLDACALIALLNEEPGKDVVKDILKQAVDDKETLVYISAVNLAEIYASYIRELGKDAAREILERIYAAPIEIVAAIPEPVYREASRLKGSYHVSLADSFGLATAFDLSGSFVTSDGEIKSVEAAEPIAILWFRPPEPKKGKKTVDVKAITRRAEEAERALAEARRHIAALEAQ